MTFSKRSLICSWAFVLAASRAASARSLSDGGGAEGPAVEGGGGGGGAVEGGGRAVEGGAAGGKGDDMEIDLEQWRSSRNATGYKGVKMLRDRYAATVWTPSGENKYLGVYDTAEEAARVHARKYLEVHGGPPKTLTDREARGNGGNGGMGAIC